MLLRRILTYIRDTQKKEEIFVNNNSRYIAVDVETSGLSVQRGGRVIEIGAVVLQGGVIVAEFGSQIDTGASISYGAFLVHGISEGMLSGQAAPEHVWSSFLKFAGDAPLVAHNAPFDSGFIRHELVLLGCELPNQWHCTVRLARQKLPQLPNHKLDTVYRYLFGGLPKSVQRHRALDDARLAARIWARLTENY
ncbi:MAG: 3'-5' exonuclease [Deltaproteobacteria bacterium]|nr:3'-5' exonuclease [Deltaproteobacteria bacterium]